MAGVIENSRKRNPLTLWLYLYMYVWVRVHTLGNSHRVHLRNAATTLKTLGSSPQMPNGFCIVNASANKQNNVEYVVRKVLTKLINFRCHCVWKKRTCLCKNKMLVIYWKVMSFGSRKQFWTKVVNSYFTSNNPSYIITFVCLKRILPTSLHTWEKWSVSFMKSVCIFLHFYVTLIWISRLTVGIKDPIIYRSVWRFQRIPSTLCTWWTCWRLWSARLTPCWPLTTCCLTCRRPPWVQPSLTTSAPTAAPRSGSASCRTMWVGETTLLF